MLPKIPYNMEKNKSQSVPIGTFNLSCNFKPGDIAYSRGISLRKYPYLTTKKQNIIQSGYSNVIAMTVFNGKIVTVRDEGDGMSAIYIENERLFSLSGTNERQFATINTKLVIMPDRVYLENGPDGMKVYQLSAEIGCGKAGFTSSAVQIPTRSLKAASGYGYELVDGVFKVQNEYNGKLKGRYLISADYRRVPDGYVYDQRITPLRLLPAEYDCSSYTQLANSMEATVKTGYMSKNTFDKVIAYQSEIKQICAYRPLGYQAAEVNVSAINVETLNNGADVWYRLVFTGNTDHYYSRDVELSGGNVYWATDKKATFDDAPHTDISRIFQCAGNSITIGHDGQQMFSGYVSEVGKVDEYDAFCVRIFRSNDEIAIDDEIYDDIDVCILGWQSLEVTDINEGDSIMISGIPDVVFEVKSKTASSITVSSENEYENCSLDALSIGEIYKIIHDNQKFLSLKTGDAVEISGCSIEENNVTFVISDIKGDTLYAASDIFAEGTSDTDVIIKRRVPQLDFVCEKDNRLYGVVNADKTIYVSALGDPTNMYVYEGVSTDSFAVAVGGEGDFTGCCKYGEGVILFKEDKLYKLVGSYPAEFALYSFDVDGLQKGAHKSMAIINEVLYYKGKNGIYAYTGGVPTLISSNLGEHVFVNAVAGTDGTSYYVSMTEGNRNYLTSFDPHLGLWVLEDNARCIDFARTPKGLFCATDGGEVYLMNASSDASGLEWEVQFVPTYETIAGKKVYSRLLLRCEIPRGSYVIIEVRSDGGEWREVGKILGMHNNVIPVRLPIARCDKFELRLRGKGEFTLLDILREYHVGSEV